MGKVYDYLQKQLKSEEHRKDAEDCLKIYEKLKEMNNGSVWESDWRQLVDVHYGEFGSGKRTYHPTNLGYVFLKGVEKEIDDNGFNIPIQTAIMSHLSDAQELVGIMPHDKGIKQRINFAKYLLLNYPDTRVKVSEKELNELWKKVNG